MQGRESICSMHPAQMIDQIMDAWEQQLKSPTRLQGAAMLPMPAVSGSGDHDPMSEMMRFWEMFPPFKLWMQAAEQWQRRLMPTGSGSDQRSRSFKNVA
jgi:hypothetical protein